MYDLTRHSTPSGFLTPIEIIYNITDRGQGEMQRPIGILICVARRGLAAVHLYMQERESRSRPYPKHQRTYILFRLPQPFACNWYVIRDSVDSVTSVLIIFTPTQKDTELSLSLRISARAQLH